MDSAQRLTKRLETFDDDDATEAVERLIAMGMPAAPALRELLSLDAMTRADGCDSGERLYYVLKALRGIGDAEAWRPALRCYLDLDAHALGDENWGDGGNPNYNTSLHALLNFAKAIAPVACAALPSVASLEEYAAARDSLRATVRDLLA